MTQSVFANHLSNACFSPSFLFVIWQGDPIPEDIYEILGGSSVRSISDLQRALRIDSVGKSPLHQTLLYFFLTLLGGGRGFASRHTINRPHYKYRNDLGAKTWLCTHLVPLKPVGARQPDAFLDLLLTAWSFEGCWLPKMIGDWQGECKELVSALFTLEDAQAAELELAKVQFSRCRKGRWK